MGESTSEVDLLAHVTLAMMAGGMGTRMGKPKAWLRVGHESILTWMLARMQWPGPTMLVAAPAISPPPGKEGFDQYVNDPVDGLGPLRGVLTALEHSMTPTVVTIAVDMPMLQQVHLAWLVERLQRNPSCLGVMSRITDDESGHVEPFPAAYRTEATPILANRLQMEQRSVRRLCDDPRFAALLVPRNWSASIWTNLNHPAEFAAFEREIIHPLRDLAT